MDFFPSWFRGIEPGPGRACFGPGYDGLFGAGLHCLETLSGRRWLGTRIVAAFPGTVQLRQGCISRGGRRPVDHGESDHHHHPHVGAGSGGDVGRWPARVQSVEPGHLAAL